MCNLINKKTTKQIYFLPVYLISFLFFGAQKVFARPNLNDASDFTKTVAEKSGVDQGSVEGVVSNTLKAGISVVGLLFFVYTPPWRNLKLFYSFYNMF